MSVLSGVREEATRHRWHSQPLPFGAGGELLTLHRAPANPEREPVRIYISAGIHGDEPAGPLALRRLLAENPWPPHAEVWCCPCLNPTGFPAGTRENALGVDLNRDYRQPRTPEIAAHVAWLRQRPRFDWTFGLHEDWEAKGFYLYELNPGGAPAPSRAMLAAVSAVCPIDTSPVIDGRPADAGLIRPDLDPELRPQWPEAFWLVMNGSSRCFTLESPSDFPMETRVAALCAGVRAGLQSV